MDERRLEKEVVSLLLVVRALREAPDPLERAPVQPE